MIDERTPAGRAEDQLGDANSESSTPKDTLCVPKETGELKVHNPRELDDARYAALDCRAHSDEARAVVAAVTDMVAAHELTAGGRDQQTEEKASRVEFSSRAVAGGPSIGAGVREGQGLRAPTDEARRLYGKQCRLSCVQGARGCPGGPWVAGEPQRLSRVGRTIRGSRG